MSAQEKSQAAELRAAYEGGARDALESVAGLTFATARSRVFDATREAARRYPDPAEPRVVRDRYGVEWRYRPLTESFAGGAFDYQVRASSGWVEQGSDEDATRWVLRPDLVGLLADLVAKPFIRDGVPQETA